MVTAIKAHAKNAIPIVSHYTKAIEGGTFYVIKRSIDFVLAALGLVVLSPLLAGIAIAIRITMGPGVIFCQLRPGLGGKIFRIYKFRTMSQIPPGSAEGASEESQITKLTEAVPEESRTTKLGAFLRRWSLDELPELLNVLKGDMSLVGPRPLLPEYLPLYTPRQARRHEVRPGITGWAQVNGRNALSWEEKFDLDVWYVDNQSILLDLRIILMTIVKVLRREGITPQGRVTVERFGAGGDSSIAEITQPEATPEEKHDAL